MWAYDLANKEWANVSNSSKLSPLSKLPALWGHTAVVHGGKMIVYGGYNAEAGATSRAVYEYDFETQLLALQAPQSAVLPAGRYGHTS
eukprot:7163012-Pyramimonas_sp.AAC.1